MLPSALKEFIISVNPQNGYNNSNSSLWTIMIQYLRLCHGNVLCFEGSKINIEETERE